MSQPLPSCFTPDGTGTRLAIHVVPRASKSEICDYQGDALKVRLQAPPVEGKANKALCAFIAEKLGLPLRDVTFASGTTSRHKTLRIPSLLPSEVMMRLALGQSSE